MNLYIIMSLWDRDIHFVSTSKEAVTKYAEQNNLEYSSGYTLLECDPHHVEYGHAKSLYDQYKVYYDLKTEQLIK